MQDLHSLDRPEVFEIISAAGGAWVIYRPVGGIGDAVMLLPTITALKKVVGNDLLVVSCVDYVEPVFHGHPYIDYILSYRKPEIDIQQDRRELKVLDQLGCAIYQYYHPCPAAVYEANHNPYMIGKDGKTTPTDLQIVKSRQEIFCDHAGVKFSMDNYAFDIPEEDNDIPEHLGLGDRYIVVQLRSHDAWRDYPRIDWLLYELEAIGRKKLDFRVVTVDSTNRVDIKGVKSFSHLNLRTVFSLIRNSLLFIGPDSMGVHVAGAMKVPTLGLFGPTDPYIRLRYRNAYWMPPYNRCTRQYCWYSPCKWRFCLASRAMRPKRIIASAKQILEEAEFYEKVA